MQELRVRDRRTDRERGRQREWDGRTDGRRERKRSESGRGREGDSCEGVRKIDGGRRLDDNPHGQEFQWMDGRRDELINRWMDDRVDGMDGWIIMDRWTEDWWLDGL